MLVFVIVTAAGEHPAESESTKLATGFSMVKNSCEAVSALHP
jgi:hypothetical protein